MDRVDLRVDLEPVGAAHLHDDTFAEASDVVAARVLDARQRAAKRWEPLGHSTNADVPGPLLRRPPWRPTHVETASLRKALDSGSLSARGYDRVLRIAWTISDLDAADRPDASAVGEAFGLRTGTAS